MEQIRTSLGPWFKVFLSITLILWALILIFHVGVPDLLLGIFAGIAGILGLITS